MLNQQNILSFWCIRLLLELPNIIHLLKSENKLHCLIRQRINLAANHLHVFYPFSKKKLQFVNKNKLRNLHCFNSNTDILTFLHINVTINIVITFNLTEAKQHFKFSLSLLVTTAVLTLTDQPFSINYKHQSNQ